MDWHAFLIGAFVGGFLGMGLMVLFMAIFTASQCEVCREAMASRHHQKRWIPQASNTGRVSK